MTKEEYINMLRNNEAFKTALSFAGDETERRIVKAHAEDFMMRFYREIFDPIYRATNNDSEAVRKACLEISKGLIKDNDDTSVEKK